MHGNTMNLRLGELVQHLSGEIGMIVHIQTYPKAPPRYDVEWYNPTHGCYRGSGISEWDMLTMQGRYRNFRDFIHGYKTR